MRSNSSSSSATFPVGSGTVIARASRQGSFGGFDSPSSYSKANNTDTDTGTYEVHDKDNDNYTDAGSIIDKVEESSEPSDILPYLLSHRIKQATAQVYAKALKEHGYDDVRSLLSPRVQGGNEVRLQAEDLEGWGVKVGHARRILGGSSAGGQHQQLDADADADAGDDCGSGGVGGEEAGKEARKDLTLKYDPTASVNDMAYAKEKLRAQARKIRELEAKLALTSNDSNSNLESGRERSTSSTPNGKSTQRPKSTNQLASSLIKPHSAPTPTSRLGFGALNNEFQSPCGDALIGKKVLSADERLRAHKARKAKERSSYSDGVWDKPDTEALAPTAAAAATATATATVKDNKSLVNKLMSKDNKERRDITKTSAKLNDSIMTGRREVENAGEDSVPMSKSKFNRNNGGSNDGMHDETAEMADGKDQNQMRSKTGQQIANYTQPASTATFASASTSAVNGAGNKKTGKVKVTVEQRKAALLARLSLSVDQRREMAKAANANGPSKGKVKAKAEAKVVKKFNMADEYGTGTGTGTGTIEVHESIESVEPSSQVHSHDQDRDRNQDQGYPQTQPQPQSQPHVKCDTCESTEQCEEDIDNTGTYYCKACWDDYDTQYNQDLLDGSLVSVKSRASTSTFMVNGRSSGERGRSGYDNVLPTSPPSFVSSNKRLAQAPATQSPPKPPSASASTSALVSITTLPIENEKVKATVNNPIPDKLYVIHDNPTLHLTTHGKNMSVLIETKDSADKNTVRIVMGVIEYSGVIPASFSDPDPNNDGCGDGGNVDPKRGTQVLTLTSLTGYTVNKSTVPTRVTPSGEIIEFSIDPSTSTLLSGPNASTSVKQYLDKCTNRVDVILDPTHSGDWHPFSEQGRSMAPQFRSKGVGYLRLGDDMSMNGRAFLSDDKFESYFEEESSSSSSSSSSSPSGSMGGSGGSGGSGGGSGPLSGLGSGLMGSGSRKSLMGLKSRGESSNSHAMLLKKKENVLSVKRTDSKSDSDSEDGDSSSSPIEDPSKLLTQLTTTTTNNAMKWHDKVQLITTLSKSVSSKQHRGSGKASEALTVLHDLITSKNVNVHVLRAGIVGIGLISSSSSRHSSPLKSKSNLLQATTTATATPAAFKVQIKCLLGLLKSKMVNVEVLNALGVMHGRCFHVKNVLGVVRDCLGLGLGNGGNGGKPGLTKGGSSKKMLMLNATASAANLNLKSPTGTVTANAAAATSTNTNAASPKLGKSGSVEIIEWLISAIDIESSSSSSTPSLTSSTSLDSNTVTALISTLLSCMENRDVNCRKCCQAGLVSLLTLGVNKGYFKCGEIEVEGGVLGDLKVGNLKVFSVIVECVSEGARVGKEKGAADSNGVSDGEGEEYAGEQYEEDEDEECFAYTDDQTPPPPSPPLDSLKTKYHEVVYLLRHPPTCQVTLNTLLESLATSKAYLASLTNTAKALGVTRGELSRVVLPYDEDTSTLDQSSITSHLHDNKLNITASELNELRRGAKCLRSMLRVKIADEADIKLADTALGECCGFFDGVAREGLERGVGGWGVLMLCEE